VDLVLIREIWSVTKRDLLSVGRPTDGCGAADVLSGERGTSRLSSQRKDVELYLEDRSSSVMSLYHASLGGPPWI